MAAHPLWNGHLRVWFVILLTLIGTVAIVGEISEQSPKAKSGMVELSR